MKCRLEENGRLLQILRSLEKGYESGDFSGFFPYLSQNCVLESQWVLTPNTGYDAIVDYYTGKGRTLADSGVFPDCEIVELIGDLNMVKNASVSVNGEPAQTIDVGILYTPGKLCLMVEQTLNGSKNGVIVDLGQYRTKLAAEPKI